MQTKKTLKVSQPRWGSVKFSWPCKCQKYPVFFCGQKKTVKPIWISAMTGLGSIYILAPSLITRVTNVALHRTTLSYCHLVTIGSQRHWFSRRFSCKLGYIFQYHRVELFFRIEPYDDPNQWCPHLSDSPATSDREVPDRTNWGFPRLRRFLPRPLLPSSAQKIYYSHFTYNI